MRRSSGETGDDPAGGGGAAGPLHRLVQQRMGERGWSYGDVARRSGLPRSTVHHLATAPMQRTPRPRTLESLAQGLELPLAAVQAAVAEAAGLTLGAVSVDPDTAVLVASIEELTAEDRQHVVALVTSLRSRSRPAPVTPV